MTLIEMLVVLTIIGVVSGAVLLEVGRIGGRNHAEAEARLLGGRLQLAADETMLGQRGLAFSWDDHGYGFSDGPSGQAVKVDDDLGGRHDLPSGTRLQVDGLDSPVPIDSDGAGPPIRAVIEDGRDSWSVRFDGLKAAVAPGTSG